ncbi:hypothetical protein [Arthrobacter sp. HLT1-21]
MNPAKYAKAITAGILAGLAVVYVGLNDNAMTAQEWVQTAQATITAAVAVYGIPNAPEGKRAKRE